MTAGIAGEAPINTVHLSLLWENGAEPEDAAELFGKDGLGHTKRVVSVLPDLLGGTWVENRGTVGAYLEKVVKLRNRVAHRGYAPTQTEAQESIKTLQEMGVFVLERLSDHRNLPRFGRTVLSLCGTAYLEQHNRLTKRLKLLLNHPNEPTWSHVFERWRFHLDHVNDPSARGTR